MLKPPKSRNAAHVIIPCAALDKLNALQQAGGLLYIKGLRNFRNLSYIFKNTHDGLGANAIEPLN